MKGEKNHFSRYFFKLANTNIKKPRKKNLPRFFLKVNLYCYSTVTDFAKLRG